MPTDMRSPNWKQPQFADIPLVVGAGDDQRASKWQREGCRKDEQDN